MSRVDREQSTFGRWDVVVAAAVVVAVAAAVSDRIHVCRNSLVTPYYLNYERSVSGGWILLIYALRSIFGA